MEQKLTCDLGDKEFRERKASIISHLKAQLVEKTNIEAGFSYTFPCNDALLDELHSFIKAERKCCAFFNFRLTITRENAILEITGPEGTQNFLSAELEF